MKLFLYPVAIMIGLWYARKHGREEVNKINVYYADKKSNSLKP